MALWLQRYWVGKSSQTYKPPRRKIRLRVHFCLTGSWRFRITEIGSTRMIMSSITLVSSSISTKIPRSPHLFSVRREGFQASLKGAHCAINPAVIAIHQATQNIKTMSLARLNLPVGKIDAYKASIEAFASVMHQTKRSSAA